MVKSGDKNQVVCFDVDDTLVMWGLPISDKHIQFSNDGYSQMLLPHQKHIDQLKKHKLQGHFVIVWSAGGATWAQQVVNTLILNQYIDLVISKPNFYYDDLPSTEWLGLPHYHTLEPEDDGGR